MAEKKPSIVEEAKTRFKRAKEAYDTTRTLAIADTRFAMGDSDNGWQWPDDIRNVRKIDKKVCLTVNVTAQHCNQVINEIRQNRPSVKVSPVDNGADKKSAEILAGLVRNIQADSNAPDAHDLAAEHSVYGGEGYWRVITEYEDEFSFNQCIKIKPIANPNLVYIDPDAAELDKSDAKYGFVFEDIPKETFEREYPVIDPTSWGDEVRKSGWATNETVRVAEYFYFELEKVTICQLADGQILPADMVPAGVKPIQTRETEIRKGKWCKLVGGHEEPLEERDWAGKYVPIIQVVGKELNVDGEIVRKGLVRDLKDPGRMVNYSYSEAIQTVALQNKIPYLATSEAIEGYEAIWKGANLENRAYLPYNAFDDQGQAIPPPQRQQPPTMPVAQVNLLQLSLDQMRGASGQHASTFGIKSEAASGVGIQRLKSQGEIATFHFPDNLARALRYEGRILVDLIQKIYDTPRVVRILGLDGTEDHIQINPQINQPYAENKITAKDVEKIFNPLLGRYDVTIDVGPSYQTQRQEAFTAMTDMASRNPALLQAAGDIIMRAADFPMADELADRLEKMVPPELKGEEGEQQIPPQAQQAMQQAMQHIQQQDVLIGQLKEALEEASKKGETEERKLDIEAYKAETERFAQVAPALSMEQVQQVVIDTIGRLLSTPPLTESPQEELIEHQPAQAGFFTPEAGEMMNG